MPKMGPIAKRFARLSRTTHASSSPRNDTHPMMTNRGTLCLKSLMSVDTKLSDEPIISKPTCAKQ